MFPAGVVAIAIGGFLVIATPYSRVQAATVGEEVSTTEGKAALLTYVGVWRRVVANALDFVVIFPLLILDVTAVLAIVYLFIQRVGLRRSAGARICRLRVVRSDGEPFGLGRALPRFVFALFVGILTMGLSFLVIAFDTKKRALHDVLAGTVVIKSR